MKNYFYRKTRGKPTVLFGLVISLCVVGCSHAKPVGLEIDSYNYTSRYIDSFTVTDENGNGAWGGDVALSDDEAGGGKSTCCVMLDKNEKKSVRLRIDWSITDIVDSQGKVIAPAEQRQAWVTISPPFPENPQEFDVHFYPDGHVEAAVTEWGEPPRIKLPKNRKEHP